MQPKSCPPIWARSSQSGAQNTYRRKRPTRHRASQVAPKGKAPLAGCVDPAGVPQLGQISSGCREVRDAASASRLAIAYSGCQPPCMLSTTWHQGTPSMRAWRAPPSGHIYAYIWPTGVGLVMPLRSASDGTHVNGSSGSERFAIADLAGSLGTPQLSQRWFARCRR